MARKVSFPWKPLSSTGVLLGALMLAASFTPSLIPRTPLVQGLVSGLCAAIGYGLGVLVRKAWACLPFSRGLPRVLCHVAMLAAMVVATCALIFAADGQDSIRLRMTMAPVGRFYAVGSCAVALLVFVVLLAVGRSFLAVIRWLHHRVRRFLPERVAIVTSVLLAVLAFWALGNGVLFRYWLRAMDSSYREYDEFMDEHDPKIAGNARPGSGLSTQEWQQLGRNGRAFVSSATDVGTLQSITGRAAKPPLRIYVGLRSADTPAQRAQLALRELIDAGAFDRGVLVVITPTGSGWVDEGAIDSIEYLMAGDVASVAMQYSYLSSPLSLLLEPGYGSDSARALYAAIHGYWSRLPPGHRPRLLLHGLSLGAMNSEQSTDVPAAPDDAFQGALWSGPPFGSALWTSFTAQRKAGSPAWRPRYGDDSRVRFIGQQGAGDLAARPWGRTRMLYLQYASDAIVFFDARDLYRPPAWLASPRGPDVSPRMRWFPLVTAVQLAFDMPMSTSTPTGFGHVYAPSHYVDAWLLLLGDVHSPDEVDRIKRKLAESREKHAL